MLLVPDRRYGIVILVVELMGLSAVLPYGFMLFRYTASKGSKGLPIDDGKVILPVDKRFHVRVLIPCYKVRASRHTASVWPVVSVWLSGFLGNT